MTDDLQLHRIPAPELRKPSEPSPKPLPHECSSLEKTRAATEFGNLKEVEQYGATDAVVTSPQNMETLPDEPNVSSTCPSQVPKTDSAQDYSPSNRPQIGFTSTSFTSTPRHSKSPVLMTNRITAKPIEPSPHVAVNHLASSEPFAESTVKCLIQLFSIAKLSKPLPSQCECTNRTQA